MDLGLGLNLNLRSNGGFSPASVSGMAYWYDALMISAANNDPVASWTDLSGNARHVTQATAEKQPLYKTNRINGRPTVLFDGSNDKLVAAFTLAQPVHLFMVINQPTYVEGGRVVDAAGTGGTGNSMGVVNFAATAELTLYAGGFGPAATPSAGPHLITALFSGAASSIGVDGAAPTVGNASTNAPDGLTIGAFGAGDSAFSNTEFGAVLAYTSAQTGATLAAINTYMMSRFGL